MDNATKPNLVLIGYRGSGKTSVGREVARRLGYRFVDTDDLIVIDAGMTIARIFEQEGEAGFRDREADAVRQVTTCDRAVISLGGGAILRDENVAWLRGAGRVIWLSAPAEVLWSRITIDTESAERRPPLTARGGLDEVKKVLADRQPRYRKAADATVDATGEIHVVAESVIRAYLSLG